MAEDTTPTENTQDASVTDAQSELTPRFALKRIYLRDASFESPLGMQGLSSISKANISQDVSTEFARIDSKHVEVLIKLTVIVKLPDDDKVIYLVEVHQAGLFEIEGITGHQVQHLIGVVCPQTIFPYVRETVDSLVIRGGFPPLALPPINFDAAFAEVVKRGWTSQGSSSEVSDEAQVS